jgi:hypothetical protein
MSRAGVAQLVERDLAKVEVTSSSLVTRSKFQNPYASRLRGFVVSGASFSLVSRPLWPLPLAPYLYRPCPSGEPHDRW